MSIVYLLSAGSYIKKNNGRLDIFAPSGECVDRQVASEVESLVIGPHSQVSTETIAMLLENNASIAYLDRRGKLLGYMGNQGLSLARLLMQQKCFGHKDIVVELIRYTIGGKMANQRRLLSTYASSMKNDVLQEAAKLIRLYEHELESSEVVEELRGFEGIASRVYFEAFGKLFDADRWDWWGRNRRPPMDPVNSMLSYGYAFLEREVREAVAGARLDPRIGFFHSNNGRKDSLVFDLMEMFRQNVIDKFVLKVLHRNILSPIDFAMEDELGCRLSDAARRKWIEYYEAYMAKPRKMLSEDSWRQHIRKQVRDFAELVWSKGAML